MVIEEMGVDLQRQIIVLYHIHNFLTRYKPATEQSGIQVFQTELTHTHLLGNNTRVKLVLVTQ